MAIPTFIYDEDLKEFYNETGEETIIAVKGDYRSRAIRFKVPIQINDGAASASYKLSDKDNFYIAWKNSNGDFGRMKAGTSSVMSAISFEDDTCTVEFKVSKELTANEGDVYLALEVVEGGGDDFSSSVVRFAPVKAKIADFLSDDDKFSPKNDAIPSGLEAQAGIINSIYFDPVEKKLVASEALKTAFVRGDERGRQVDFAIPCALGGGASVWQGDTVEVMYKNANGETGSKRIRSDLLEFTSRRAYTGTIFRGDGESGGICRFQFYAPASLTAYEGDAEIQVSITKENGSTIHLSPAKLQVGPFFDQSAIEPEDPKYEIIEDLKASIKRLEGLITSNGNVSLDGYLTKNEAAEAYATLEGVNETYLTKTAAAGIYETAESASATYLTKAEAKRDYISSVEAYQLNAYHGYHAYGPSTFMLDASFVNEAVISFYCGYPTTVDVAFKGVGGATLATKTVPVDGTTYLSVFRVADAVAGSDGRTTHYIYTKVGDSPATGPLDPSASATYASDSDYLAAIDFGQIPDRCQVDVVTR